MPSETKALALHLVRTRKWPEGFTAAHWLDETALRLFPDSSYAKEHAV